MRFFSSKQHAFAVEKKEKRKRPRGLTRKYTDNTMYRGLKKGKDKVKKAQNSLSELKRVKQEKKRTCQKA